MVRAGEGKYGLCIVCVSVYDILAVLLSCKHMPSREAPV